MKEEKAIVEKVKEEILSLEFLEKCFIEETKLGDGKSWYILNKDNKKYLVERRGSCNPKKCSSACCKFMQAVRISSAEGMKYYSGFGKQNKWGVMIDKKCKNLVKGKCSVWKTKKFPQVCEQFPHPIDEVYWAVFKKCSFYFVLLGELK